MNKLPFLILIGIVFGACEKKSSPEESINTDIIFSSNCPSLAETVVLDSEIEFITIPDKNFEASLSQYDSDNKVNGRILKTDANKIDTLLLMFQGGYQYREWTAKSLKGIENFQNLKFFNCNNQDIDTLDLRSNKNLEYLQFEGISSGGGEIPQGKALLLGENSHLKYIKFSSTRFPQIDLRGTPNVEILDVQGNINSGFSPPVYIYINNATDIKPNWKKSDYAKYVVCK